MLQQYMKELEQDPYDPEQFIEKLAWKILGNSKKEGVEIFDPVVMEETFVQCIKDFKLLQDRQKKKCEKLEQLCHEEEVRHVQQLSHIQEKNKLSMNMFQALDERINYIATKVIHLGNQLEAVNTPRSRAVEAQKLMSYFSEFLSPGPLLIDVFNDKDHIDEAADIIQKLYHISQEIPDEKFAEAKKKIAVKYDEIERSFIEEFVKAHRTLDLNRMKEIASILSHFKGYAQCVDAYIEQCQLSTFNGKDPFREVIPLCERSFKTIHTVFNNPDQVMAKFVLNIFHLKLQNHIVAVLSDERDKKQYLQHLMDVYMKTQQVLELISTSPT
uniref:Exocyst complex component 5 n=1 Tax=Cacopsylla melanoneura TaxID=428564 RepID=A0A8D8Y3G9_9HEMI